MDKLHPLKGKKDGACNRTACQRFVANCYNKVMKAYYCRECAKMLNRYPLHDGTFLCEIPKDEPDQETV